VEPSVVALDVRGLQSVVAANPWIGAEDPAWRDGVAELRPAHPFLVGRLWLDREVAPERAPFAGTAGLGIVDNISCVHRYQGEARRWALRTGGAVMELHAYALPHGVDERAARAELIGALHTLYPETRDAQVLDERWLLRDDCPAFEPGSWARRPAVQTPSPGVALAGDLVRLPFPTALMERAVSSGFLAANALLARWGVAGEPVWSIPQRGLLAGLQGWKRRVQAR
jgi:isorenieratene synthase